MISYFLNYSSNEVSINTYRLSGASATDVNDICAAFLDERNEELTASLNIYCKEEAQKIMSIAEKCETYDELMGFVLGEGDFLYFALERVLGLDLADYPELRDIQRDQFTHLDL